MAWCWWLSNCGQVQGGSDQWWSKPLRANTLCCSGWQCFSQRCGEKLKNVEIYQFITRNLVCQAKNKETAKKWKREKGGIEWFDRHKKMGGCQWNGREYFWEKVMGASSVGSWTHYQQPPEWSHKSFCPDNFGNKWGGSAWRTSMMLMVQQILGWYQVWFKRGSYLYITNCAKLFREQGQRCQRCVGRGEKFASLHLCNRAGGCAPFEKIFTHIYLAWDRMIFLYIETKRICKCKKIFI